MNYKLVNGKYVFNNSGVNFSLSAAQVTEMRYLLEHIDAVDSSSYIKREDCLKRTKIRARAQLFLILDSIFSGTN